VSKTDASAGNAANGREAREMLEFRRMSPSHDSIISPTEVAVIA
jgi:hypothetical protein